MDKKEEFKEFIRSKPELVEYIKKHSSLEVAVAGYPEKHPTAPSLEEDIKRLKTKVETGAVCIFNQMCFDNKNFLNYRDKCEAMGISKPQIAGIFPITNYKQIKEGTHGVYLTIPDSSAPQIPSVFPLQAGDLCTCYVYGSRNAGTLSLLKVKDTPDLS